MLLTAVRMLGSLVVLSQLAYEARRPCTSPRNAAAVWRYGTENVAQPVLSTVGASYSKAKKLLLYSPRDVAVAAARRFRAGWLHDFGSPSMGVGCENNSF